MYKIGVLQFEPKFLKIQENLKKMEELLATVNADLVVLPELATSGYLFKTKSELEKAAEPAKTGVTANLFTRLAKEKNTSYVVGFAEKDGDKFYNSSLLVNPAGTIHVYRKTHLFYEEKKWFLPGNSGLKVFEAKDGVKVGLMICFDWIFPESARTLALRGAQIIAHSANLVLPWCQQAMITRSLENRVFSITSNRTGTEKNMDSELTFTGMSQILSTKGEILHRCTETEETVQIVEIYPEKADDKKVTEYNHAFNDRRTEMYEC
ncbi:MAG: beta-ureidopropionase [Candidatus Cloacimonetes bacterium]|nr:beta-ureidopropionase [Candidatus Cloacimonadota bacterium]MCF7813492.1 beta-ureidopropionase [Candidatus Cloacimonadota bacterium]MCF7868585.1 beta-ureidopropionase [Candidatus Cloacimonadota bacterium]MCF7883372.1 beta-ureidopropionase [Candidatus Cloacimonadota bacterium]